MPRKIPSYRPAGAPTPQDNRRAYINISSSKYSDDFYNSTPWRKLRKAHKVEFPLCADCLKEGRDTAAQQTHHLKDRATHPDLELDWDNLQSLCIYHHNMKRRDR